MRPTASLALFALSRSFVDRLVYLIWMVTSCGYVCPCNIPNELSLSPQRIAPLGQFEIWCTHSRLSIPRTVC